MTLDEIERAARGDLSAERAAELCRQANKIRREADDAGNFPTMARAADLADRINSVREAS